MLRSQFIISRFRRGFTLTETLAASTILCGAVMAMTALSTQAMRYTQENRQYETAALLLDKQIGMIDYIGLDDFLEADQTEGAFEGYEVPYQWSVQSQYTEIDSLFLLHVTVSWPGRTGMLSISAQTMLNGDSLLAEDAAAIGGTGSIGGEGSMIEGGGAR